MRYDTRSFRYDHRGGFRSHGYDVEFGNWGARSGLHGATPPPRRWQGSATYDHGYQPAPRGYDRNYPGSRRNEAPGYDSGWGMARLHHQMMQERGAGFDYEGDYNRRHALDPREFGRGYRNRGSDEYRFRHAPRYHR